MKEHGLLCTASVALALHEGRRTQDRRPIKSQPAAVFGEGRDYFLQDEEGTMINCPVQARVHCLRVAQSALEELMKAAEEGFKVSEQEMQRLRNRVLYLREAAGADR